MTNAKEIDDLFMVLQTEANKFNAASPTVKLLLDLADQRLRTANPGVAAWLNNLLEPSENEEWWSDEDSNGESHRLGVEFEAYQVGFARVGDGWGLASRTVQVNRFDEDPSNDRIVVTNWHQLGEMAGTHEKTVPIGNAPMGVRIAALELLPDLFRRLTEKVRQRNAAIESATKR